MAERDPVSVLWDRGAAQLLARARSARGGWAATRISDPTPRQRAALLGAYGIDPDGPDRPSTARRRGGLNARTRWARGFVRSVHWLNDTRHGGPGLALEVEVGAHRPAVGVIPAGRSVRVRVRRGGSVALRAVGRKPDSARIWDDAGLPAGRFSDPSLRDWLSGTVAERHAEHALDLGHVLFNPGQLVFRRRVLHVCFEHVESRLDVAPAISGDEC